MAASPPRRPRSRLGKIKIAQPCGKVLRRGNALPGRVFSLSQVGREDEQQCADHEGRREATDAPGMKATESNAGRAVPSELLICPAYGPSSFCIVFCGTMWQRPRRSTGKLQTVFLGHTPLWGQVSASWKGRRCSPTLTLGLPSRPDEADKTVFPHAEKREGE